MILPDKCPLCGSLKLLTGRLAANEGGCCFAPDEATVPFWKLVSATAIPLEVEAYLCAGCWTVFTQVNPKKASDFLERFGSDVLKARLATLDSSTSTEPEAPPLPSDLSD